MINGEDKKHRLAGVVFEDCEKIYHYLSGELALAPFDVVIVPVGDGKMKQAVVAEILECTPQNSPYPIEKMKSVSEKADVDRVDLTADNIEKWAYKPVKLVFKDFNNLSCTLGKIKVSEDGRTLLRFFYEQKKVAAPIDSIAFLIPEAYDDTGV